MNNEPVKQQPTKDHNKVVMAIKYIGVDYFIQIYSADNKPEHRYNIPVSGKQARKIAEQEGLEIIKEQQLKGSTL